MKLRPGIAAAAALALVSCGGGGEYPVNENPQQSVAQPPPSTSAAPASFDVLPCLTQNTGAGITTAQLVVPDALTIDFSRPSAFPNGRALPDPVIDIILAALFLDLQTQSAASFARVPVNPPANDRPFRSQFPFLAPPQGNPPVESPGGTNFNFRTDPETAYARVDRTGFPALATALVSSANRIPFNEDDSADDLSTNAQGTFKWVPEFEAGLVALTNALGDDIEALGFRLCARKR